MIFHVITLLIKCTALTSMWYSNLIGEASLISYIGIKVEQFYSQRHNEIVASIIIGIVRGLLLSQARVC